MGSGFTHLLFPVGLELRHFVFNEQLTSLLVIHRPSLKVRTNFARQRRLKVNFGGVVKEGKQLVKLLLADRIVLVIMTTGATHGQTQPHRSHGAGSIDYLFHPKFLFVHPALAVGASVTVESCSNFFFNGGIWQQVAGKLLHSELIERNVPIESLNDPVTPAPSVRSGAINVITIAIGKPCQIEPLASPLFPIMR